MNKHLLVSLLALPAYVVAIPAATAQSASAQQTATRTTPAPTAPDRLEFAGISVRLDPGAQRIVQQDINALLSNRRYWEAKLDRVMLHFPLIEAILLSENVPTDFKYLAVQESSLTPDAVSASAAVGYWQFKRETALLHGMRVDEEVDERKSITSSTRGAASYLKRSNAIYNNWVSSLYSFYLGASGISKLVPPDWSNAREVVLDSRTDRYILRFMAHKIAIDNALRTYQTPNNYALVTYPRANGRTIADIATELNVDPYEIKKYNRWLLGESIPTDRDYVVVVPVANNQINDVRQRLGTVASAAPAVNNRPSSRSANVVAGPQSDVGFPVLRRTTGPTTDRNEPIFYEINGLPGIQAQVGDNAASLARKSRISVSSFLRYNDMYPNDPIVVGDVYYVTKKRRKADVAYHTSRAGETPRSVSQRYGLRLKRLLKNNRMDRDERLVTGRVLWLQERRPASRPIEIINAPTPPVYDRTPTTSAPVVAQQARPVSGSEGIPRNASERRLYQPKLVSPAETPTTTTASRATTSWGESADSRTASAPTSVRPTERSGVNASATYAPSRSTTSPAPTGPRDNNPSAERIIIVRADDGSTQTTTLRPTAPAAPVASASAGLTAGTPVRSGVSDSRAADSRAADSRAADSRVAYNRPTYSRTVETRVTDVRTTEPRPTGSPANANPVATSRPAAPAPSQPTGRRGMLAHNVEAGQTYYSISKQYGLTVEELLALNNLAADAKLAVGQTLLVRSGGSTNGATTPAKPATTTSAVSAKAPASGKGEEMLTHTVEKGETMFRISKQYGVSIEQLQEWNQISDNAVKEGQKIKIFRQL